MDKPYVSIGLPVYNGGAYLEDALKSLVAQSFDEFEIVISDNASNDDTGAISQDFAADDRRIRYTRNTENLGAADNFNQTFQLANGRYFKWAAHDDVYAPDFLLRCVQVLDSNPIVAICYSRQVDIDEEGERICYNAYRVRADLHRPYQRFADVMDFLRGAPAIWGLMRKHTLQRTSLIGKYYASDLVLLAETSPPWHFL